MREWNVVVVQMMETVTWKMTCRHRMKSPGGQSCGCDDGTKCDVKMFCEYMMQTVLAQTQRKNVIRLQY